MARKMLRFVEKTRSSSSQKRSEHAAHPCRGPGGQGGAEMSTADRLGSVQGKGRAGPGPAGEGRKPVAGRCVELAMTHRFSVPGMVQAEVTAPGRQDRG